MTSPWLTPKEAADVIADNGSKLEFPALTKKSNKKGKK